MIGFLMGDAGNNRVNLMGYAGSNRVFNGGF